MKSGLLFTLTVCVICITPILGIRGGTDSRLQSHLVHIITLRAFPGLASYGCGSFITRNHILTSAHLIDEYVALQLGYRSTNLFELTSFPAADVILHPDFNTDDNQRSNDIAIIFITYIVTAIPIQLPARLSFPTIGTQLLVAGFGYTRPNEAFPHTYLQQTWNSIVEWEECENVFNLTEKHFCAQDTAVLTGLCEGDDGTALFQSISGENVMIGIASLIVPGCTAEYPVGYIKVSEYIDWIMEIIN